MIPVDQLKAQRTPHLVSFLAVSSVRSSFARGIRISRFETLAPSTFFCGFEQMSRTMLLISHWMLSMRSYEAANRLHTELNSLGMGQLVGC